MDKKSLVLTVDGKRVPRHRTISRKRALANARNNAQQKSNRRVEKA